jgi:tetratricopeptide (TPR) repeat protein
VPCLGQELPPSTFPGDTEVIDGGAPSVEIDPGLRRRIAEALKANEYAEAETLLLEAAEAEPKSAEVLRLLGGVFFVRGRYLNAAVAFKKAEALAPLDERSRFTLAMSYVTLGRRDWARPELETLARGAPQNPLYPYWIARLDYDDAQYEDAVAGLLRAIELDPAFLKAYDNLGLCYEALGRFDDAIRGFEKAIRLNRESEVQSPWPALNFGLLLTRLDRLEEAEALFRESVHADPLFPKAHYELGVVLEKTSRPEEAIAELEEAARLDEAYAEPHYALARVYRRTGKQEQARRALERFQAIKKEQEEQAAQGPG